MHFVSALAVLAAIPLSLSQTTGKLGDAKIVTDSPKGASYVAWFNGTVKGTVNATSSSMGVNYTVDVMGLPTDKGPFKYHVHVNPVPADGNCTGSGGHLDPFERGDTPACNVTSPATCQVGDLSGKYGTVAGPEGKKSFNDPYTSLNMSNVAFFGNRSAVFHDASGARIACANFTKA